MLRIKRVPTVVSNYQKDEAEEGARRVGGCGRNCLNQCCIPGICWNTLYLGFEFEFVLYVFARLLIYIVKKMGQILIFFGGFLNWFLALFLSGILFIYLGLE